MIRLRTVALMADDKTTKTKVAKGDVEKGAAVKEVAEAKKQPQLPRMWGWMILSACLIAALWVIRVPSMADYLTAKGVPGDIIVLVHKAATIVLGAVGGMYLDRSAFPYGRPDRLVDPNEDGAWEIEEAVVFTGACIRRAIVMSAFMFAAGLAL